MRSVFNEEKKLSIAALSQQLPERLMLHARPWSAKSRWNGSLVYGLVSIGVMQHGLELALPPDGHDQRIGDQLCRHRRLHGPAHYSSGEEIGHRRDIEPPFVGPRIGKVRHPFPIRSGSVKLTIEHIR